MYLSGQRALHVILITTCFLAAVFSDWECRDAAAAEIPIEAAVYHVLRPGGSQKTYLDVVVGGNYSGRLPNDIDSITVTGPVGVLPIGKEDFKYNPQWRAFWIVLPGPPNIGAYTFKLVSKDAVGHATDTQSSVTTIPIPDASELTPAGGETGSCRTSGFSWSLIDSPGPLYYQLQIRDADRKHVYRTGYVRDAASFRLPPDLLQPGATYQWRVRAADGPDWISLNNRSHSKWVKFTKNSTEQACRYRYQVPVQTDDGWPTSSLANEGIDPQKIAGMIRGILNADIANIHSVLIVKNGKLVLEEYFYGHARTLRHRLASVSKSITAILIGIARDQKKIAGIHQRMIDSFPSYSDVARNERKKKIQLHHVLTMTAGLEWNTWTYPDGDMRDSTYAMSQSEDWIRYVLGKEVVDPPGRRYAYNNGLTMLLGEILRGATGLYADQYAEKYLFAPLGISDYSWHKLPDGIINTAGGLHLRPRDMAKIGIMMLDGGRWKGKQIVSAAWVNESTRAHVQQKILFGSGYGYQWWRGRSFIGGKKLDLFYAAGRGGQYIFVCPELDLVVVVTSKWDNDALGEFRPQIMMSQSILPAMLPAAPLRKAVPIDAKIAEQVVGEYESQTVQLPLTIFSEGDNLFFKTPAEEKGQLCAESAYRFWGVSEEIGDFPVDFFKDQTGNVSHLVVQVGFGFWRFDKVK